MDAKSGSDFENLGSPRAERREYTFGGGPKVIDNDESRGVILAAERRHYLSEFCTHVTKKSDNIPTDKPRGLALSNRLTRELINADGIIEVAQASVASVYSYNDFAIKAYPKWRHTSDIVERHYHQRALRELAQGQGLQPYTLNIKLSPALGREVINNGGCPYLLERLALKLNRALGRRPTMWLVLEAATTETSKNPIKSGKGPLNRTRGVLHVHGAIAMQKSEMATVARVIRAMNASNNSVFKNNEFESKRISDDAYWVEYCNKHQHLNQMFLNGLEHYSRSLALCSQAKKLYEADRKQYKKVSKW